jgi:hypothetical protein
MANSDTTLNFLIRLGVIGQADVKAANDLLKDTTDATKSGGAADSAAAADTEKLNLKKEQLRKLLHGLPPEFSQAGSAFTNLFFNPQFAGMLALTAIYQLAKKGIEETNAALDATGAAAAQSATGGLENYRAVLGDIHSALAKFRADLAMAGVDMDPFAAKLKEQAALFNLQADIIEKISGRSAGKPKFAIDQLKTEIAARSAAQPDLDAAVQTAAAAKAESDLKLKNSKKEDADMADKIAKAQAAFDAAQTKYDKAYSLGNLAYYGPFVGSVRKQATTERDTAARERDALIARRTQLAAGDQSEMDSAAIRDRAFADAQALALKNKTRVGQLSGEISLASGLEDTAVAGRAVTTAVSLADRFKAGENLSADEQQLLMRTANIKTGHSNSLAQAADALAAIRDSNSELGSLMRQFADIAKSLSAQVADIKQQTKNLSGRTQANQSQ